MSAPIVAESEALLKSLVEAVQQALQPVVGRANATRSRAETVVLAA